MVWFLGIDDNFMGGNNRLCCLSGIGLQFVAVSYLPNQIEYDNLCFYKKWSTKRKCLWKIEKNW